MTVMMREIIAQMFRKPGTNPFPAVYAPHSVTAFLKAVGEGKAEILPPVAPPKGMRGKIDYNKGKCIGCKLCTQVCPARAVVFIPETKKVIFHVDRCSFCGQCADICPVKVITMTDNFLLAYYDRKGPDAIIDPPVEEAAPEPSKAEAAPEKDDAAAEEKTTDSPAEKKEETEEH
jgi:formate hydrogenlyase subunit 6/NADH:ubiquinone oxidoreductase subunit I